MTWPNDTIDYGSLANISIRPILTPLDSKNDLCFEVVFFKYLKGDETQSFFMCKIDPIFLKKLGQHFIDCVDKCNNLKSKKIFNESQYKDFGLRAVKEDIVKQNYMG